MNPHTDCESRDLFIRFKDVILYVLLRWRSLLLVALAVAVAATGVKFWMDTNRYNAIEAAPEESAVANLDEAGEAHVNQVKLLERNYQYLSHYTAVAPMMQIDFQKTHTQKMEYLISGSKSYEEATMCREYLSSPLSYKDLAKELSTKETTITSDYLVELVTVKVERDTTEKGNSVFLHVTVIAPNKKLCASLAEQVRAISADVEGRVNEEIGYYNTCRWLSDQYGTAYNKAVQDWQNDRRADEELARLDLQKAKDALTQEEEDYLFVSGRKEEPTKTYPAPRISKIAFVLGFFGGALLLALWYVIGYLFCDRVLSAAEMTARHGVPVYGVLPGEKKQGIVARTLRGWLQDEDTEPCLLWSRLALAAQKEGVQSVYVVGDAARMEDLPRMMERQGIALQIGSSPLANVEAMEAVAQSDAMILTADLEVTGHKTVAAEMELAEQVGCKTLGAVLVKK